jgi:hypothetical protein
VTEGSRRREKILTNKQTNKKAKRSLPGSHRQHLRHHLHVALVALLPQLIFLGRQRRERLPDLLLGRDKYRALVLRLGPALHRPAAADVPELLEDFLVGGDGGIEGDPDDLRVAVAVAHGVVGDPPPPLVGSPPPPQLPTLVDVTPGSAAKCASSSQGCLIQYYMFVLSTTFPS